MYTTVLAVMKLLLLLLLYLIRTGVNGIDLLSIKRLGYEITYPCDKDLVCYHIWQINAIRNIYLAIVSNGVAEKSNTQEDRCFLPIEDFPLEDIGRHFCHEDPNALSSVVSHSDAPVLNVLPGNTVSLQCVVLWPSCFTQTLRPRVRLIWVDENGSKIQNDSQHQILVLNHCNVILTVTYQNPGKTTYRCQATVGAQVLTSVDFPVRAPARNGRRGVIEMEPDQEGGSQDVVGTAVGVVVCLVLTALIAAFVVNRRRTNSRLPDEPGSDQSTSNHVTDTDDVIYADISFLAGSE